MEFDTEKYVDAIQSALVAYKNSKEKSVKTLPESFFPVFQCLRVSRFCLLRTSLSEDYAIELDDSEICCYENGTYDSENSFVINNLESAFIKIKYIFYPFKDQEAFSQKEKECLEYVSSLMFMLAGNISLTNHALFARTHDMRFSNVYNVEFAHKTVNKLIEIGKIEDYGFIMYNIRQLSRVNKKYGQQMGSRILEEYHNDIQKIFNNTEQDIDGFDFALGGDNGAIIFKKEFRDQLIAYLTSKEIIVEIDDGPKENITINSSFGINMELEGYDTSFKLFDTGSVTLNMARQNPKNRYVEYDERFRKGNEMQRKVESWYKDALKNDEFLVYYQPKVDLHDYSLKGAEALVRWIHNGIMVYPDQFIPVLERNYSIKYLDMYMLNHVCADIKKWLSEGKNVPVISVNLSRASLGLDNLLNLISSTIDKYEIPRSLIQIELTESGSDITNESLRPLVEGLNHEGITTAVDDFGTGFSSLSLIKELPWDVLKIDKSLLHGAQKEGSRDQQMFKSIITMANTIGLECIVEGVETKDDVRILKESNCFMAQGYYFSKPVPKDDFEKMLQEK